MTATATPAPVVARPSPFGRVHCVEALRALRKLPDASVDALVTDPPYSSGGFTRGDRLADPLVKYARAPNCATFAGDTRDARSFGYWCALWLSESLRALRPGSFAFVFADWRQLPLMTDAFQAGGFVWRGIIAWDKGEGCFPQPGRPRAQAEFVVWGTKGPAPAQGSPHPGVMRFPVIRSDKHHLTGKPTELMRAIVRISPPGSLILDPFAGSGTTGVACALEGRRFLGFELSAEYVEIANARIAAAEKGARAKT